MDEAIECYQRAANTFKMAKKWGNAGEAFIKAGNLHLQNGSRHDAATNFVDAANCYKKSDPKGVYLFNQKVTAVYWYCIRIYSSTVT